MNPLTVAIMIITVLSAVAGVFIANTMIIPRLASRREALVAASSGVVTLVGFYAVVAGYPGYMILMVLVVPGTMVAVCTVGMFKQAIFGFR